MHARLDQLLSLRDGAPVYSAAQDHVRTCAQCSRTLAEIADVRQRLAALPELAGDADHWPVVQQKLRARACSRRRIHHVSRWSAAASLAVLLVAGAVQFAQREPGADPRGRTAAVVVPKPSDRLQDLHAQSRELERLLAALPSRPAVARASTSLPIDSLEAQVQWIDHRLSVGPDAGAVLQDQQELWRQRVEVMNSLVRLRYAETQQVPM